MAEREKRLIESLNTLEKMLGGVFKTLGGGAKSEHNHHACHDKAILHKVEHRSHCAITPRRDKVDVFVRVVFLKVGEVDTVHEKFMADVFIQAHWKEPALDKKSQASDDDLLDWNTFWNPKLYVENGLGELKETTWYTVGYSEAGKATVYQKRRLKGTFFEKMELMEYPFDTQDLTVTISSERSEHELDLISDPVEVSSVNVQSFVDEQEWNLHKHVNSWRHVTSNMYKHSKHKHPAISISCRVSRRSQFFLWNVIIIMIFISSLVFTTWTIEQDRPQNRLQLSFILLLSNITFKFTVSQTLPKVPYLTILDKYIIFSGAQLCLVCVWHAIASQLMYMYDKTKAAQADQMALIIQGVAYIIFNLCYFIHGRCITITRLKEFAKKDRRHQAKLKAMEEILTSREKRSKS